MAFARCRILTQARSPIGLSRVAAGDAPVSRWLTGSRKALPLSSMYPVPVITAKTGTVAFTSGALPSLEDRGSGYDPLPQTSPLTPGDQTPHHSPCPSHLPRWRPFARPVHRQMRRGTMLHHHSRFVPPCHASAWPASSPHPMAPPPRRTPTRRPRARRLCAAAAPIPHPRHRSLLRRRRTTANRPSFSGHASRWEHPPPDLL